MGIKGLLDLVAPVTTNVHISEYHDKVVAVGARVLLCSSFVWRLFDRSLPDGFCWMHKSTFSCATDLCMGRPTDKLSCPLEFFFPLWRAC